MASVRDKGSEHYKNLDPEPIDVIRGWNLSFELGSVLKYVARHKQKGTPVEDLKKAIHFLELELEKYLDTEFEPVGVEPKRLTFRYKDAAGNVSDREVVDAKYNTRLGLVFGYDLHRQGIRAFKTSRMQGGATYNGLWYAPSMVKYALPMEDNDR